MNVGKYGHKLVFLDPNNMFSIGGL